MPRPILTAFANSPDRGRGQARDMRVRWALEEVGQDYDVRLVSFAQMKQPPHLALHDRISDTRVLRRTASDRLPAWATLWLLAQLLAAVVAVAWLFLWLQAAMQAAMQQALGDF